jgi:hypothetical protein
MSGYHAEFSAKHHALRGWSGHYRASRPGGGVTQGVVRCSKGMVRFFQTSEAAQLAAAREMTRALSEPMVPVDPAQSRRLTTRHGARAKAEMYFWGRH